MSSDIDLNGIRMNAVLTAAQGVIGVETVFTFGQEGERVWAHYAGGRVERGYLVGRLHGRALEFTFCQRHTDGVLDGGRSRCAASRDEEGRLQLVEEFVWQDGRSGRNVLRELPAAEA